MDLYYKIENTTLVKRPWGHEVAVTILDHDDTDFAQGHITGFETKPNDIELKNRAQLILDKVQFSINNPEPEPEATYTESEIVEILKGKGYDVESLDDLPIKKEI